jgi:hypothetical protein
VSCDAPLVPASAIGEMLIGGYIAFKFQYAKFNFKNNMPIADLKQSRRDFNYLFKTSGYLYFCGIVTHNSLRKLAECCVFLTRYRQ